MMKSYQDARTSHSRCSAKGNPSGQLVYNYSVASTVLAFVSGLIFYREKLGTRLV